MPRHIDVDSTRSEWSAFNNFKCGVASFSSNIGGYSVSKCVSGSLVSHMARMGIRSIVRKKFRVRTTDSNHANPVAPNTLGRKFTDAKAPDQIWGTDITYIHTDEGVLYLAGVMDLFSRRIVGWSMDDTMTTKLVENALSNALSSRKPSLPLLHHSDRGVQYTGAGCRELLASNGIQASMSRTGDCYDNAVVESFRGKLKTEMVYHRSFKNRAEAKAAAFDYIEVFYNRQRLHASLGYQSPEQFEASRTGRSECVNGNWVRSVLYVVATA